jgi:NAD(P)-dependent dehydrogenase (short-subunit alcohol dehydrogenase family)
MDRASHIALVTEANRGIGLEVVHQLARQGMRVVLGARDHAKGERAAQSLAQEGLSVFPYQLDVTDQQSIDRLHADVTTEFGRLDILVNNAGILYDIWQQATAADLHVVHTALETNLFGVWCMCQAFLLLLRQSHAGRIVNVSSEAGSLARMGGGTPAYSVSKASLNALTRILAAKLAGTGILVNAVCPGWVATDMGGAGGRAVSGSTRLRPVFLMDACSLLLSVPFFAFYLFDPFSVHPFPLEQANQAVQHAQNHGWAFHLTALQSTIV